MHLHSFRAGPPARKLSAQVELLLAEVGEHPITLRHVVKVLEGRAYMLLLILLALPFVPPIPLPGLSTLFGIMIALIGLRLAFRSEPWLPRRMLDAPLSARRARQMLSTARRIALILEKLVRPRWSFLVDPPPFQHLYGALICLCGAVMSIPFPIPFANMLPATTVVMLGSALVERDGYFAVAGMLLFVVDVLFFGAILFGGASFVMWLQQHFGWR